MAPVPERLPSNKQVMSLQPSKYSSINITCKKYNNILFNGHLLQLESRNIITRQQYTCSESSNYL
ncbi:hypothetical protein C0J52_12303 [Blattella germanica]|nr:hypothetical protein C0J52_12303 [Blattella germanica]